MGLILGGILGRNSACFLSLSIMHSVSFPIVPSHSASCLYSSNITTEAPRYLLHKHRPLALVGMKPNMVIVREPSLEGSLFFLLYRGATEELWGAPRHVAALCIVSAYLMSLFSRIDFGYILLFPTQWNSFSNSH